MGFCQKCGSQLNEGAAFCTNCGNAVAGTSMSQAIPTQQVHTMREEFSSLGLLGVKHFIFTENSLVYGNDEYFYSVLNPIFMVTPPTPITNGVAQTTVNGKLLTLGFPNSQKERFAMALAYANEQIDLAHGNIKNYKYSLLAHTGTKLEVYEDYLIIYYVKPGATSVISNIMQGGASSIIISFANLTSVQFIKPVGVNDGYLQFDYYKNADENGNISIPVKQENYELAQEAYDYIEESRNSAKTETQTSPEEQELCEQVKGVAREFPLFGKIFEVTENQDIYNTYRQNFFKLARKYSDKVEKEYKSKIHDLDTFAEFFPDIYYDNLDPLIKRAVDILISEGVWSITYESFLENYRADFHNATDYYEALASGFNKTLENNQKVTAGITGMVPNLWGGGFGLKGAIKGIAKAEAFNFVRDGIESHLLKNSNVNQAQRNELYQRIKPYELFNRVFIDFWNVFVPLINFLNENGRNIGFSTSDPNNQADSIFQNLSNPNFPQDKISDVLFDIIISHPYTIEYYEFAISKFGETEEIITIKNYFQP